MDFYLVFIVVFGGFLAGILNTFAGNGSAITLTILMEFLGLPPDIANGTNRIGVLGQSVIGAFGFKKNGKLSIENSKPIMLPLLIGAIVGVIVSIKISPEAFKIIFKYLMILLLFLIVLKPKKFINHEGKKKEIHPIVFNIIFIALGFYGGFIQMGMGIFFLITMMLLTPYGILESNAIKVFTLSVYTFFVVLVFWWNGLIDWKYGLLMAVGQTLGGYFASYKITKTPYAEKIAYYFLIIALILVIVKMFFF